jgi:subtilisin family serine protease
VYNRTFDDTIVEAHQAKVVATVRKRHLMAKRDGMGGHLLSPDVQTFKMGGWRAMALEADDRMIMEVMDADEVAFVEADVRVKISATTSQAGAPLGLVRISHARAAVGSTYVFDTTGGTGITAYVVDTGIMTSHSEFQGRATFGANFVNNIDTDENGHGSHVSGTIGGRTFGVAKNVRLVAVKVLDADGAGSNSGVIAGMNFGEDRSSARSGV